MDKLKQRRLIAVGILVAIALLAAFGYYQYNATYATVNGIRYARSITELDISGTALADPQSLVKLDNLQALHLENTGITSDDYEMLREAMPDCKIFWTPMFQGAAYPEDTAHLTVSSLSSEDIAQLAYFPKLQTINAAQCKDYDNLLALKAQYPDLQVTYSVTIGQREFLSDTSFARIPEPDYEEVLTMLKYLPKLEMVLFPNATPSEDQLAALSSAYPHIQWHYDAEFLGLSFRTEVTNLDLTGLSLQKPEDVEAILPHLPNLKTVIMCGYGFTNEEMDALRRRHAGITFVWDMMIGETLVRTDDVEIDISYNQMTPADIEALLPYFTQLEKVVMSHCGISNEEMDALNRRHEDIKFVWTVELGPIVKVRTDITSFIPFKYCVDFYQEDLYNLRYCTDIIALDLGHQQIYSCEFVAFMPNLKYLVLADTKVLDLTPLTGLTNLVYLEIFVTYLQDYEPLLTLTGLRDLNLSWTYGDYKIIAQMPWLERCWWGGYWHSLQVRQYLQEKCPNTQFEFDDPESTGSGWRTSKYYYEMRDTLGMFYMP